MPQPPPPRPYNPPKNLNNQTPQANRFQQEPSPPLPLPAGEIYKHLLAHGQIAPTPIPPSQPPYPKWYDPNARCVYHAGALGHTIENCVGFKAKVQYLIKNGWVSFEGLAKGPNITTNPLPNHAQGSGGVGTISLEKVKDPFPLILRLPWERLFIALVKGGHIPSSQEVLGTCLFCHQVSDHGIQDCGLFAEKLKQFVDLGVIQVERKTIKGEEIGVIGDGPPTPYAFKCAAQDGVPVATPVKLVFKFAQNIPSHDLHAVPFDYGYTVIATPPFATSAAETFNIGGMTRTGRCYISDDVEKQRLAKGKGPLIPEAVVEKEQRMNEPVTEDNAAEFLKIMKRSEFNVIEQLKKTPARISIMELILTSEPHRQSLLKVLNEAFVTKDITVEGVENLVGRIQALSTITFSEGELGLEGTSHNKALYITVECKGHIIAKALIDNGSALNVMPKHVLAQLPIDMTLLKPSGMTARAFDGTIREIIGSLDLDMVIGPHTFTLTFQIMEIEPAYSMLVGRPWIHAAGAVPSSLHQCLKYVKDGVLITIRAEEALILAKHSSVPYIEATETLESSFQAFEIVNAEWIEEGSPLVKVQVPEETMIVTHVMSKDNSQLGKRLGAMLQVRSHATGNKGFNNPKMFGNRFGLGYKPTEADLIRVSKEKKEKNLAKLFGRLAPFRGMSIPHIRTTFPFAAEIVNLDSTIAGVAQDFHVCTLGEEAPSQGSAIFVKKSGGSVRNWTAITLPNIYV